MKKIIFAILFLSAPAFAVSLEEAAKTIHDSSAGSLIVVNSYWVALANGSPLSIDHVNSTVLLANTFCDFSRQWNVFDSNIYCIAK